MPRLLFASGHGVSGPIPAWQVRATCRGPIAGDQPAALPRDFFDAYTGATYNDPIAGS